MEKLFCMQVAAQLTIAAANGMGANTQRVVDPTLQDPGQRNINLEVWEIFRAYYVAITQAIADNTDWPAPAVPAGQTIPTGIASAITAAMPSISPALASGPLGIMLQALTKAVTTAAPKPIAAATATKVPSPGATTPATAAPTPVVQVTTPAVQATVTAPTS